MVVYLHKNKKTEQVFYVGIGLKKERAYSFIGKARSKYWHNYVKKHGEPIVEIIATFDNRKDAANLEMQLISKHKRVCDGGSLVNITLGGDGGGLGIKQSAEVIEKRIGALRGKTHTEQAVKNMREAQNRPEVKAKHELYRKDSLWLKLQKDLKIGGRLSDEHKAKISKSNKGRIVSEETKRRISEAKKGEKRTLEQRRKISQAQKGKKLTKEHITNLANGHKKIILNTENGIFYKGFEEAANSIGINKNTLRCKLSGHLRNNTPFIYA